MMLLGEVGFAGFVEVGTAMTMTMMMAMMMIMMMIMRNIKVFCCCLLVS